MKQDRGKAAAVESNYVNDGNFPCNKHPSSYSVGICSYCLKERLVNLLCSECGEKRLSSCSCSDDINSTSYRNSCSAEIGSVGRISFLLENEKNEIDEKIEQVLLLRNSNNCVEIKNNDQNGFWKIKRLFRKKKEKGQQKSVVVSRSRSLCSFRNNDDDACSEHRFSSAKISDFTTRGLFFDYDEPRKSENFGDFKNLGKKFPVKESDFSTNMDDDSAFIDLKIDDFTRLGNISSMGSLRGGSCRMKEVNECDGNMKRGKKVWKWIFRQKNYFGRKSTSNIDEDSNLIIKF